MLYIISFNKIFSFFFDRERLAEVQDEYEERERRWNRIAILVDREDLISNSSLSTTTSMVGNQYPTGNINVSMASGINNNAPTGD
jgi:hypothetical protein